MGGTAQKSVTVKLFPEEVEACEVIAQLAGWEGKSTALREFMKIWIEAAVVTIDTQSPTKGTVQIMKSMQRLQKQMRTIQRNTTEEMVFPEQVEILRKVLA